MMVIVQALFLILWPAAVLVASKRFRILGFIGSTVLCYLTGILLGNLPFVPLNKALSTSIAQVAVPLAIPLLLFSTDFVRWLRLAKSTVLSFFLIIIAVMGASAIGARVFAGKVDEFWKVAGMFVGVYTGGTPNLTAIGLALGVRNETFILVNAADVVVSGLYLIFLMTVAQRLLLKFLPRFRYSDLPTDELPGSAVPGAVVGAAPGPAPGGAPPSVAPPSPLALAMARARKPALPLGLAFGTVALSVGASMALLHRISEPVVILAITTIAIAASFLAKVRRLEGTYETGEYLLLIFCVSIGTLANFRELITSPVIFAYCALVVVTAVLIHFALAAVFRIDADTAIITSTAGIFSPAFVGPVAAALKNREIVVSGVTTGLVGYAVGNYLGLALAYLLKP